jgi:hypothetical protein
VPLQRTERARDVCPTEYRITELAGGTIDLIGLARQVECLSRATLLDVEPGEVVVERDDHRFFAERAHTVARMLEQRDCRGVVVLVEAHDCLEVDRARFLVAVAGLAPALGGALAERQRARKFLGSVVGVAQVVVG